MVFLKGNRCSGSIDLLNRQERGVEGLCEDKFHTSAFVMKKISRTITRSKCDKNEKKKEKGGTGELPGRPDC